jgi:tetratricopeptide (TPR) repeat protein
VRSAAAANEALFEAILPDGLTDQEIAEFAAAMGALRGGNRAPAEALLASLPAGRRPGDLRRPYFEALLASATGDNVRVIERLLECERESPGNPVIAVQLAMSLKGIQRIEEAIAVLERAIEKNPLDASLRGILEQIKAERK